MTKRKTKLLPSIAVAVATLGLLGAVTYVFLWDPTPDWEAAPNDAATRITSEELAQVADLRMFFRDLMYFCNCTSVTPENCILQRLSFFVDQPGKQDLL